MAAVTIDHVTLTPDDQVVLYLVDEPPAPPDVVEQRVVGAANFALSGDMAARFPSAAGHPVRIRFEHTAPPAPEVSAVLEELGRRLALEGIPLDVAQLDLS